MVTLAYGSTRDTEADWGAAHVLVDPFATPYRNSGLSAATYFYPSRLVSIGPELLTASAGRIIDEMPAIRDELRSALGFGTGVTTEPNLPGSNLRGRVVRLKSRVLNWIGYAMGVIVTEPEYSRCQRQQTLVPLFPEADYATEDLDVVVADRGWLRYLSPDGSPMILAVPMVTSLFEPSWFASYTPAVIDDETMRRVEAALELHFGL